MKRRILAVLLALSLAVSYTSPVVASDVDIDEDIEEEQEAEELISDYEFDEISVSEGDDTDFPDIQYETLAEEEEEPSDSADSDEVTMPTGGAMEIENPLEVDDPVPYEEIDWDEAGFMSAEPSASYLDSCYIPDVLPRLRCQTPYGTCWAHASMALAEMSLIKQNIAYSDVDLSELHLAYFTYNTVTDPLGGTEGDYNAAVLGDGTILDRGGSAEFAQNVLASWTGAADESTASYKSMATKALGAGLDPSIAYEDEAHLSHYFITNLSSSNRTNIKKLVAECGAVSVAYAAINSKKTAKSKGVYNEEYNSYYNDAEQKTNHEVAIVGWDDDFPKSHFTKTPPGNGAWLIRNSWVEGDFDTKQDYFGYFWMSYYEGSLTGKAVAAVYDAANKYDNNYQYDGGMATSRVIVGDCKKAANIFEICGNAQTEELEAVSFYTASSDVDYTISIYLNPDENGAPDSGELVPECTTMGKTSFAGYYTVPLNNPIVLEHGTRFAAIVELSMSKGSPVYGVEDGYNGSWYTTTVSCKEGQSYVYDGRRWMDYKFYADFYKQGNIRIKAFTKNCISELPPVINPVTVTFDAGEGAVSISEMSILPCHEYGELPVAVRTGYNFNGWYTGKTGGSRVTADMKVGDEDIIQYNLMLTADQEPCLPRPFTTTA